MAGRGFIKLEDKSEIKVDVSHADPIKDQTFKESLAYLSLQPNVVRGFFLDTDYSHEEQVAWFNQVKNWLGVERACFITKKENKYRLTALYEDLVIVFCAPSDCPSNLKLPKLKTVIICPQIFEFFNLSAYLGFVFLDVIDKFSELSSVPLLKIVASIEMGCFKLLSEKENKQFLPDFLHNEVRELSTIAAKFKKEVNSKLQKRFESPRTLPSDFSFVENLFEICRGGDTLRDPAQCELPEALSKKYQTIIKFYGEERPATRLSKTASFDTEVPGKNFKSKKTGNSRKHLVSQSFTAGYGATFENDADGLVEDKPEQLLSINNPRSDNGDLENQAGNNNKRKICILAVLTGIVGGVAGLTVYFTTRTTNNEDNSFCPEPYIAAFNNWSKRFECSICPEWPVYYLDINNTQGCLDGLMAASRNATQIISGVQHLVKFSGIKVFDFSRQDLTSWLERDWHNLLSTFETAKIQLQLLNVSSSSNFLDSPSVANLLRLNSFLSRVRVNAIDLRNQRLGSMGLTYLQPGLSAAPTLEGLYLQNTQLLADGMAALKDIITNNQNLKTLHVQDNAIGDNGAVILGEGLQNSTVTDLDVSKNPRVKALGIRAILQAAKTKDLRILDLSGIPLPDDALDYVGESFQYLQRISLAYCSLQPADFEIFSSYLPNARVFDFTFDGNEADGRAIANFLKLLPANPGNKRISCKDNMIQSSFKDIASGIESARVTSFSIAGNPIPRQALPDLVRNILPHLDELDISNSNGGDALAVAVSQTLNQGVRIRRVRLDNNRISDSGGIQFLQSAVNSQLQEVHLANNYLTGNVLVQIRNFNQSQILLLNVEGNYIAGKNLTKFIYDALTKNTLLQSLRVGRNPLQDADVELAKALITSDSEMDHLGDADYDVVFARKLQESKPATSLIELDFTESKVDSVTMRALCRAAPAAKFPKGGIRFQKDSSETQGDLSLCSQSASSNNEMYTSSAVRGAQPWTSQLKLHLEIMGSALQEAVKALRKMRFQSNYAAQFNANPAAQGIFTAFENPQIDFTFSESELRMSRNYSPSFFVSPENVNNPSMPASLSLLEGSKNGFAKNNESIGFIPMLFIGLFVFYVLKRVMQMFDNSLGYFTTEEKPEKTKLNSPRLTN